MRLNYPDLKNLADNDLMNHFLFYGYKEGRLSSLPRIDFDFYLQKYSFSINKDIYNTNDKKASLNNF